MSVEEDIPASVFDRLDPSPDALFYAAPRLVNHIDPATIESLSAFYAEILFEGAAILDLMSSWVSHLPATPVAGHVAGLGMNAEELAANPRLDEYVVHDLNADPELPFTSSAFDFVFIAVSIQYLTRPVAVFAEIARVLKPRGRVICAMSHRCFPTKAIRAFHGATAAERVALVSEFVRRSGRFEEAQFIDRSPPAADPLWLVSAVAHPASY